jgi:RimJ/RimL family protein N-acetyltransferase
MATLTDIYPPFALRVRSGDLELRVIRDEDIPELVALAEEGIHDPATMPFAFPWTDAPVSELGLNMARFYWRSRADSVPDSWSLECTVRRDGQLLGVQGVSTKDFLVTRTGETGSWLAKRHQGQGVGTRMRRAMCMLAFDHLGFEEVTSGAFLDNHASRAVSRKVGYRSNGVVRHKRRDDDLARLELLVLSPADLVRDGTEISVEGVAELRRFIGLDR